MLCDKNFNFPKIHYLQHLFDDIENKGSARLYTTKPGEGFHVGLIDAYHASNKKNVAAHVGTTVQTQFTTFADLCT